MRLANDYGSSTSTGTWLSVFVPVPSCPPLFAPQHLTVPTVVSAQLKAVPIATAATPEVRPETCTGTALAVTESLPSCPTGFQPQH